MKHRLYPVLESNPPEYIPYEILIPHEAQALKNHSNQTLERLAERGGLGWTEILAILEDRDFQKMDASQAREQVLRYVALWEDRQ